MASGAEVSFKSVVNTILGGIRQIIVGKLAEAIAGMVAGESSKGIFGLATAAIGITGVMALFNNLPKFATGGIIGGTSFGGDQLLVRANSGEMILNPQQQASLFDIANGGGSLRGEVRFEIEGSKLVGVLSRYSKTISSYN